MRYGDKDGPLITGWNYWCVRLGPIGYNGLRDWLKLDPVFDKEFLPWYDWYDVLYAFEVGFRNILLIFKN